MTNEEELKKLVETASTNIKAAREKLINTSKEEFSKLETFFEEHENEIALPISCVSNHVDENDFSATKLTRDFRVRGWKGDSFFIQYKNGDSVPLTPELLSKIVFIDDDGKQIADEFREVGELKKPRSQAYADLMTTGRYAVIIYRCDWNDYPKVYIGRIRYYETWWRDKTRIQMSHNGKLFDIADNPSYLLDAVTFSNPNDFCEYVSKFGLSNGQDFTKGVFKLVRNDLTIQK